MRKHLAWIASAIALASGGTAAADPPIPPQAASAPASSTGRPAEPVAVLIFEPDFFADLRPNTAQDMVSRVPGFTISDGDGGRGFEGAVGNVLINGARPASKTDTGSSVLSRTPAAQVARIELVRGAAPGIDMQGFPVVVNVILIAQGSREHVLQSDGNIFFGGGRDVWGFRYQFTARDADRTWGVILSDNVTVNDSSGPGISTRRDSAGRILRIEDFVNDYYGGGYALRGNYASALLGGKIELTLGVGMSDVESFERFKSPVSLSESTSSGDGSSGELGAIFTRSLGSALALESRFIHEFRSSESISTANRALNGTVAPPERFESVSESSETIARSLLRWEPSPVLTFEGGGEIAYNLLETDQSFERGGTDVPLPSASVTVEETRAEGFGKVTWRISPTLSSEVGVRVETSTISQSGDANQEKTFSFIKPRVHATWSPWANNQFRFRLERDVGQLNFGQFAASAQLDQRLVLGGNADLEPEERWIGELAYERRFWEEGILSLAIRHDEISNVIDRIPLQGGLTAIGNIGDGTLDQVSFNLVVPTDRLGVPGGRLQMRNDWRDTEVTDPTTGRQRSISNLRPSQPSYNFTQDLPNWDLSWTIAYVDRFQQITYSPDQTFGYVGFDYLQAAIEYKPSSTLSLRFQITLWEDFTLRQTFYADRTPARRVAQTETRVIDPREFLTVRLRKTF